MTVTVSSVCPKCGIAKRSGKSSCCGRGGSWFGNCGSTGDTKVDHTWYEGLQACKARTQSKTVIGQQLNGVQQGSKAVSTTVFAMVPASANTSKVTASIATANTANTTSTHIAISHNFPPVLVTAPVHTTTTSRGCERLLDIHVHISLLLTRELLQCYTL